MKLCVRITCDNQGGYIALCTSLPGCMARGESRQEAMDRLREAVCGYLAAVSNFVPENLPQEFVEA